MRGDSRSRSPIPHPAPQGEWRHLKRTALPVREDLHCVERGLWTQQCLFAVAADLKLVRT